MQKRRYRLVVLLAALLIGFLVSSLVITRWYVKRQDLLVHRHFLLCEVLKPGMTKDEVLDTLRRTGEFISNGAESHNPNIVLHIVFEDEKNKEMYGVFDLVFSENKYVLAYELGFDSLEVICDFRQPTQSITVRP